MPDRNALNQSGLFNAITNYGVANAAETMPTSYDYYSKSSNNAQDIAKTTNPYDFSEVDSMTADEQAQLPIDPLTPQRSMFSKAMDFMPFIGDKSLTGMATQGIGNLFSGLDQFDTLSPADQQFILEQGESMGGNKDPFGINIRSGFGNYADYVRTKGQFAKGKRGNYYKSLIPGLELAEAETKQREIDKKIAEQKALDAALARAQAEIARMGYQDYGQGGVQDGNYDTSNIDDAGNYSDSLDPGQTE
jgi:hypothetical protein